MSSYSIIFASPPSPLQLEVYREEIALGEKAVASLKRQQASYEERATVVATEWNLLQSHVETLAARVTGGGAASNPNAKPNHQVPLQDPFLARLVNASGGDDTNGTSGSRKRGRDETDDVNGKNAKKNNQNEQNESDSEDEDGAAKDVGGLDDEDKKAVDQLKARAGYVKDLLGKVLDAVDAANKKQTDSSSEAMSKDLQAARARVAQLDAKSSSDFAEIENLRSQTTKQRKRNEELGTKLDDTVADVEMLRRQLRMARSESNQIEGLPPMATAHSAKAAAAVAVSAAAGGGKEGKKPGDTPAGGAKTQVGTGTSTPGPSENGAASPEEVTRMQGLVHELEGRLKASSEQLESTSKKIGSLEGDLRGLKHELNDENRHFTSRAYKQLELRLNETRDESQRFRQLMSDLQREGDILRHDLRASTALSSKTIEAQRRSQLAEARVHDMEARMRSALDERDKVSLQLLNSVETASKKKLEEDRIKALAKLREENTALRKQVTEARATKTALDAAKLDAEKAMADANAARAEAQDAVKVFQNVKTSGDKKTIADLEKDLAAAKRDATAATAKATAAEQSLTEKNEETEAFMAEMEAIGLAYEEAASENARLMERLAERDDGVTKAVTEKNQLSMSVRRLRDDLQGMEAVVAHERGAAQAALARVSQIEAAANEARSEIDRAREDAKALSSEMATQTATLTTLHESNEKNKQLLHTKEKEVSNLLQTSKDDAKKVAEAERKYQKCEEQCAGLKRRNEKLSKHGGSADEYKEEIDAYKSMLRCSVCNDRPKGVVITRCFHMFCNDCIAIRLENRDRKCPGCGLMFSASDVKSIFF